MVSSWTSTDKRFIDWFVERFLKGEKFGLFIKLACELRYVRSFFDVMAGYSCGRVTSNVVTGVGV